MSKMSEMSFAFPMSKMSKTDQTHPRVIMPCVEDVEDGKRTYTYIFV